MHRPTLIVVALILSFSSERDAHAQPRFYALSSTNQFGQEIGDGIFQPYEDLTIPTVAIGGHNGAVIYGISDTSELLQLPLPTFQPVPIGALGNKVQALAIASGGPLSGIIFGLSYQDLYMVNASTAVSTLVGQMGDFTESGLVGAAFDNYNTLYLTEQNGLPDSSLYTVNATTGLAALVGPIGYAVTSLAYDNGSLYGFTAGGEMISISRSSGAGAFLFNETGQNGIIVGVSSAAIPEPSTFILAAIGALALLAYRRAAS